MIGITLVMSLAIRFFLFAVLGALVASKEVMELLDAFFPKPAEKKTFRNCQRKGGGFGWK